jgi:type I restriction enzyme S subunit
MQVIHGATALAPREFAGAAISKSYSSFIGTPICDIEFFSWLAKHPLMYAYYADASQGVVIEKMTFDQDRWLSYPVFLPPVAEQLTIAKMLGAMDEAIRSTEGVIVKLEYAKQGIRHDLLTRGIDKSGNLRDPLRNPGQFFGTPLGLLPREWNVRRLGEVVSKAQYGVSFPLEYGDGVPVLRMNNLHEGEVTLQDIKTCSTHIPSHLFLKKGDILFNRTNSMEHVGRVAIWREADKRFSFASYLVRLVHDRGVVAPEYLNMWLNQPETRIRIREFATPAVQQVNVNPTNLMRVLIAYPTSKIEQDAICERASALDDELSRLRNALCKRRLLRQGLIDDLLTGRVRVRGSE